MQDRVIQEVYRRERRERLAMVELFAGILVTSLKVPDEVVQPLLDHYFDELSHDRYRTSIIAVRRTARSVETKKAQDAQRILSKVEKMTVDDKDLDPPPPARGRGKPHRRK